MSSISPGSEAPWPLSSFIDLQRQYADAFYNAPRHLQQSILPWTFAGLVINEANSTNPAVERAVVSKESYGKQLGRISDALETVIEQTKVKHNEAIDQFLELKANVDSIKHDVEATRFKVVVADLKRLRKCDPRRFQDCLEEIAALADRKRIGTQPSGQTQTATGGTAHQDGKS